MKKAALTDFMICFSVVLLTFGIFFYGAEYLATNRKTYYALYFNFEKKIPYIPFFYIWYYIVFILPALIPVYIKDKKELYLLTYKLVAAIITGGLFFLIMPCKIGYHTPENHFWIESVTRHVAGKYNLFPSLHVALTLLIVNSIWKQAGREMKISLSILTCMMIMSTIFTHQHHLLDIIGGFAVTIFLYNLRV